MAFTSGTRIGAYEIVAPLGAGGMGEVYRARDTKLKRDVAIKVLPGIVAGDPEHLGRLAREAQTLAALNHQNIAAIYGFESQTASGPPTALVMELVDGEDLSAIIKRGPVALADARAIACQISDALDAAHEHGIVHRDLKPANVKVRADGTVKVLDFGLAKAVRPDAAVPLHAEDTRTLSGGTRIGTILGTAAYMAPEQVKALPVDRRADIWAFGVVLYEMLTARRAFGGADTSEILASVLRQDVDFSALPEDTPPAVRRLLRRCLQRDVRKRLSAIADARLELDEPDDPPIRPIASTPRRATRLFRYVPWLAAAGLAVLTAVLWWMPAPTTPTSRLSRLSILAPPGTEIYPDSNGVALSPDGSMVAFIVGGASQSYTQLWVQDFRSRSARRLEDAEGALLLFWSPDSGRIGFFANGKLKTIAASGGRAEVVCDAPNGRGGAWTASNVIVFAPDITGPLSRVDARGGAPEPLTTLDLGRQQSGHRFPLMLPDGVHFLFAAIPSRNGQFDVFAGSLGGGQPVFVTAMESAPAYADPGWLLYGRQGALVAQPFDPETLKLSGAIVPLDDEPTVILGGRPWTAGRPVTASTTGSLAYFSAPSIKSRLTWMEASGRITPAFEIPAGHYESVTISPDGSQAVLMRSSAPSEASLWLADIARGSTSLFASGPGRNELPVWSPEGKRVAFATDRDGPQNIVVKTVGEDEEHTILRSAVLFKDPASWSSDGKWLVLGHVDPVTGRNIYRMPASGGELTPLVRGPGVDRAGPVSPNGRWLAYITDESGRNQLYVQPFPDSGRRVPVSNDSAVSSWWTDDNAALLFTSADLRTLWRAEISPGDPVRVGAVKQLADLPANVIAIDAMPDRQRFLVITPERPGPGSITVVQNWRAGLGSAAPASPR